MGLCGNLAQKTTLTRALFYHAFSLAVKTKDNQDVVEIDEMSVLSLLGLASLPINKKTKKRNRNHQTQVVKNHSNDVTQSYVFIKRRGQKNYRTKLYDLT